MLCSGPLSLRGVGGEDKRKGDREKEERGREQKKRIKFWRLAAFEVGATHPAAATRASISFHYGGVPLPFD